MTSVAAFERQIRFELIEPLTGDAHRRAFAAFAAQVRDEEIARQVARGGFRPHVTQRVDGRPDAPLESVRIGGHIRFDFRYLIEVVVFALAALRALSPTESGAYREAWACMFNNRKIDVMRIPPQATEVIVVNDRPYARKIQVGSKGFTAHAHIVDKAAKLVRSHYPTVVRADIRFVQLTGAYSLSKPPKRGQKLTYPALVLGVHR